ncbi:MAG TPA: amidohydrolase [Tepidisphaeraceae bacterium]|nr:amidohydrolase [Tepidisphaeraceae bacterium]
MFPDTILYNGNIITLNERRPHASALAIYGERITFVGPDEPTLLQAGSRTRQINLNGKTVVPGFCDSHIHLVWFGMNLLTQADLIGSESMSEVLERLADIAAKSAGWIRGHGFDQSKLTEGQFPTRQQLDTVSADRPIVISRVCGHAGVANSAAIALLSPTERAAGDESTGLYTEQALWTIYRYIPQPTDEQMAEAILAAGKVLLDTGITSVQTLLDTPEQMRGFTQLHRAGALPVRATVMPPWSAVEELSRNGIRTGFGDQWLKIGAAKLFSDGSLGAHTALLAEPYTDRPDTSGLRIYPPDELKRRALVAQAAGFQVAIHAIGDQAVNETIDAIEYALQNDRQSRDNVYHRHRIEHASLASPAAVERLARLQIVTTFQPQFVTSDTWTPVRIGPARVPWAYPFKSILSAGIPGTLSSDCPVERPDAFECLASAVGRHRWSMDERLSPLQAIEVYCLGSAYAGHAEDRQGSLETGKLADLVVLSNDPARLTAEQLRATRAEQVWLGGKRVR